MGPFIGFTFALCGAVLVSRAMDIPVIWGNGAGSGQAQIQGFDLSDGSVVKDHRLMLSTFNERARASDMGRGITVVGDDIYYATAGSGMIYKTNARRHCLQW